MCAALHLRPEGVVSRGWSGRSPSRRLLRFARSRRFSARWIRSRTVASTHAWHFSSLSSRTFGPASRPAHRLTTAPYRFFTHAAPRPIKPALCAPATMSPGLDGEHVRSPVAGAATHRRPCACPPEIYPVALSRRMLALRDDLANAQCPALRSMAMACLWRKRGPTTESTAARA